MFLILLFLSTPSARRATVSLPTISAWLTNFYPRPPRGGRLAPCGPAAHEVQISIHALREEGDRLEVVTMNVSEQFLSTPSARRATTVDAIVHLLVIISIHALREEGDLLARLEGYGTGRFLSTPSARRATDSKDAEVHHPEISIHALREEGDPIREAVLLHRYISIHALREEGDSKNRDKISIFL